MKRSIFCTVILCAIQLIVSTISGAQVALTAPEVINIWRSERPDGTKLDLTLMDKNGIEEADMVASLAASVKATDVQSTVFAVRTLEVLLAGRSVDTLLLTGLRSHDASVRTQSAQALETIQDKVLKTDLIMQLQRSYPNQFMSLASTINIALSTSLASVDMARLLTKQAIHDPDQNVRKAATSALRPILTVPGVKDAIIEVLGGEPAGIGEVAVWAVDSVGPNDKNRAAAWIQILAAVQSSDGIPALAMLFGYSDFSTAWNAAQTAALLAGESGVIAALEVALADNRAAIRLAAVRSLGDIAAGLQVAIERQIGDTKQLPPQSVSNLLVLLGDSVPEIRWSAVQAVARWADRGLSIGGGIAALNYIVREITEPEQVRSIAARLLLRIDPNSLDFPEGSLLPVLHRLDPVYHSGTEGYNTFRIPAILVSPKGSLLAFAEGRRNSRSDTGDIDLVLKRSEDNGLTWSLLKVIWDGGGRNTAGNPTPVVDEDTGRIWLFMTHNLGTDSQDSIQKGTSTGVRTIWATYSDDDGYTWAPPTNLFKDVQSPDTRWDATGPSTGIQLHQGVHRGRLIIPAIGRTIYSDDHGVTWHQGTKFGGTSESQIVELTDGRLLRNDRAVARLVPNRRPLTHSDDQGETWGATRYAPELVESYVQASTIRYVASDSLSPENKILLFSNPAHATERVNMTVKVSLDEGETWPVAKTIHAGPSAYSCLVRLPDQTIGLLFEGGSSYMYDNIYFTRFTLDWLLDQR